jgi:hypothetical protein
MGKGLRLFAFERRAAIFYRIKANEIQNVAVMYRGRDYHDHQFSEEG